MKLLPPPRVNVWIMALTLLVTAAPLVQAQTAAPLSYGVENDIFHPVTAPHGMVASVDKTATEVGVAILRQGGNAVDAAVAVGFALAASCCCVRRQGRPWRSIFARWRRRVPRARCLLVRMVTPTVGSP